MKFFYSKFLLILFFITITLIKLNSLKRYFFTSTFDDVELEREESNSMTDYQYSRYVSPTKLMTTHWTFVQLIHEKLS